MKILILGNGFECQYNPNVRNFNQKFVEFINDDVKVKKLIQSITAFCDHDKQIYHVIIATIRNEIKFNDNFILEAELRDIGTRLANNSFNNPFINEDLIFHCLKNLVGAVIYEFTKDYQEIDQYMDFWMKACPDQIWTTNYTNSAQSAYRCWTKNSLFQPLDLMNGYSDALLRRAKVIYLHGQFLFQDQDNKRVVDYRTSGLGINNDGFSLNAAPSRSTVVTKEKNSQGCFVDDATFQNIEINLAKKNERPLKNAISQILWNQNELIKIDVFGLSVNNDEGLFTILISELERSNVNYELNFYYYTEADKKNFEAFKQEHLNNKLVVNPLVHYNLGGEQKTTQNHIKIISAKEYKGFKLKKQ